MAIICMGTRGRKNVTAIKNLRLLLTALLAIRLNINRGGRKVRRERPKNIEASSQETQ